MTNAERARIRRAVGAVREQIDKARALLDSSLTWDVLSDRARASITHATNLLELAGQRYGEAYDYE